MTCKNCKHHILKTDVFSGEQFDWCNMFSDNFDDDKSDECIAYKPKTNSDKIRCMKDEELASFIVNDIFDCNDCPSGQENMDNPFGVRCDNKCVEHCLDWLRKEVNEK